MGTKFTDDQRRAIDLRNCNILVSAAAGSGKTAVLVERIVRLVTDPESAVDIDRLLVVTFTNAAAAQMRERLERELFALSQERPEDLHLQRQLTLLHNAQITTIDSFCLYLIRNHFHEIGLDPDFRVADDGEQKLLAQDVLGELLEEAYARSEPAFLHCVECFVTGGRDGKLEELILSLYEFAMSYPWPEEWLAAHREDFSFSSPEELQKTDWFALVWKEVRETLLACEQQLEETAALCRQPDGPYPYLPALEADRTLVEALRRAAGTAAADTDGRVPDAAAFYAAIQALSFVRLPVKKDAAVSSQKRERAKKERERVKQLLSGLRDGCFAVPPERWAFDMRKAAPALQTLVDLVLAFMRRLEKKKREKNLLDFSDMEHLALKILLVRNADGVVCASKTAEEYRAHFAQILIDEYQDSNLVQELLLTSISGEEQGRFDRFMVGDVKQSIYKFRLARPELFLEKFDRYQKTGGNCVRVDLRQNFRSRSQVTACVNDIFSRIMHRELGGVEYDRDAALYPAAQFPEPPVEQGGPYAAHSPYEPELLLAVSEENGEKARQQEARMTAARIRELVGHLPVRDKSTGKLRPAAYGDMVILLRTAAGWDETFKQVLEEERIPVHVTSRTGYFAAKEVQNVLHFLRVLNNPLQDVPLFGVLHSPIGGFSDEEIAMLRTGEEKRRKKLFVCLEEAAGSGTDPDGGPEGRGQDAVMGLCAYPEELTEKCRNFLELVRRFREYAVYLPIHSLLEKFLEETGYLYQVTAMPGGNRRRVNVEMLLTRAESFEKTSYFGLFHFIRYMEQLEKYEIDYGEAGDLDENADVVRIMSIHKSKGLEFPICFVCGLSKRFNRQDQRQPVIMDMDLGLAIDCVDPTARTRRATLKKKILTAKRGRDDLGEELRVLYVAMTRAEEKLILTAACGEEDAPEESGEEESAGACFPQENAAETAHAGVADGDFAGEGAAAGTVFAARLREASCYLDMLLGPWRASGYAVHCFRQADLVRREIAFAADGNRLRERLLRAETVQEPELGEYQRLRERLTAPYAHADLADLFVKTTVSELKMAGMQEMAEGSAELFREEVAVPYVPRFVEAREEGIGGALRGSAYHRLLELFPFEEKGAGGWTRERIEEVIRRKRETGELSAQYAAAVNPGKVERFLASGLAERMRAALERGRLFREQPFVLGIPASRLKPGLPEQETVLVQGIIDVFFEEDGALVVADYKTDAVSEPEELVRRYRVQLAYYAQALERLTGKPVKERLLYSFALAQEIPVDCIVKM